MAEDPVSLQQKSQQKGERTDEYSYRLFETNRMGRCRRFHNGLFPLDLTVGFHWLTPVDEWDELKKGNLAIAIVMASVIIGFALVISSAIAPPPLSP